MIFFAFARDEITYISSDGKRYSEKISSIRLYSGEKFEQVDSVSAGEIAAVLGLSQSYVGQGLGFECDSAKPVLEPVLSYRINLPDGCDPVLYFPKFKELEEEEPSKFEKWLSDKFGGKITDVIMIFSLILGLGLSALLFVFLPIWITAGINFLLDWFFYTSMPAWLSALVEGVVKMAIFVGYLAAVSLMPEIKRTFMYHGAEHKSIACFESGEELTPANAMKHTRFHPRCGTSFMFFMILLGIFAGFIIKTILPDLPTWGYTCIRLLILPLLMGLGYEFIRFAGKHPNAVTRALSAPGLWVQRITTKEPTEDMLEVAITSLKCALRDDFDEFREFFEAKPWEPEEVKSEESEAQNEEAPAEKDGISNKTSVTIDINGMKFTLTKKNDEDKSEE